MSASSVHGSDCEMNALSASNVHHDEGTARYTVFLSDGPLVNVLIMELFGSGGKWYERGKADRFLGCLPT